MNRGVVPLTMYTFLCKYMDKDFEYILTLCSVDINPIYSSIKYENNYKSNFNIFPRVF